MCGIVGYVGEREAQPIIVDSLKRLEYRGYDSCGLAVREGDLRVVKDAVRIDALARGLAANSGRIGVGHTRWATHGKPSRANAHPHLDCTGRIAVVHNGVIDNFQRLRERLVGEGHLFRSETDTEVIPHLIEDYYQGDMEQAVRRALADITGSYAIIVIHRDCDYLLAARQESPLIIGLGDRENLLASDVPAVLDYTDRVLYLEDGDLAVVGRSEVRIVNGAGVVERAEHRIPWTLEEAQKAGYEHFMLKEIHEQPRVIQNTFKGHISSIEPVVELALAGDTQFSSILILACGTSYHAALVGEQVLQQLARIPVRARIASEFNYSHPALGGTWVIGITQSGETADTLKALKRARELGARTLAITNVVGSSVTRIADEVLYTRAGPEIGVAATKTFTAQLVALYLLALSSAMIGSTPPARLSEELLSLRARVGLIRGLTELPGKVQRLLEQDGPILEVARYLSDYENVFFVGRGLNLPVALEGALKMKEIAYIHAEGYAAGELKHGPFALLTPRTPVIAVAARDQTYETLLVNIKEIKARESPVIALAEEGDTEIGKYVDSVVRIPEVDPLFSPVPNSVALQLLAYYTARERGCEIDLPRNLAKSVTVE